MVDDQTEEPLAAVNVVIEGTPYGGTTNAEGFYLIRNIPAGEHTVRFSFVGYRPLRMEEVAILPSLRTVVDVRLEPAEVQMSPLTVTADRPLIQKDVTGTMHRVGSVAIQNLPVDTVQEMVELQPGVTAGGHVRGGRSTETLYVMDGLPVQDPVSGGAAAGVPRAAITELNVHTGGFDTEFGNALSGVVHIITRRGGNSPETMVRYERDDLGAPFGGSEHSGRMEAEVMSSGPILRDRAFWLIAGDLVTDRTRWRQDFEQTTLEPPHRRDWNLFGRADVYLGPDLRLAGEALSSHTWGRGYEWRWRFNLDGLPVNWRASDRLSLSMNHLLAPWIFYDLQFSTLRIRSGVNSDDRAELEERSLWSYDSFLQYVDAGERLWWYRGDQTVNTTRGSVTAHLGSHRLKAGFDLSFYQLDSDLLKLEPRTTFYGQPMPEEPPLDYSSSYRYFPRVGNFYLQDTYEAEDGLVLKGGLRYDWLDPRARRPVIEWVPTTTEEFQQEITGWVPAERKHQVSPRVGLSFPLDERTYFLFNYGLFFQVPLFDQLYSGLDLDLTRGLRVLVGNPDLKHMRTKAYEFAFRRAFDERTVGSFTYFFKESNNLIDTKTFLATDSRALEDGYTQYVNLPLARSSGVEAALERRPAPELPGVRVAYTYMVARGHADTGTSGLSYFTWGFQPSRRMHFLSWDQRHTLAVDVNGMWNGLGYHLVGRYSSPRPYTYAPSPNGVLPADEEIMPNDSRMRDTFTLDLRINRSIPFEVAGRSMLLVLYGDVRNLTDRKNVLWIASNGKIGGELGDPGAFAIGRRTRIGLEVRF